MIHNPNQKFHSGIGHVHRAGFTLIEILISVFIIVLLAGLLLSGLLAAKKHANEIRIKDDLQLIGTALEAYKNDNSGQFPVFADPLTDANSGNIQGNGLWLDYQQGRGAVLLCRALIGPGPAGTSAIASPGDDGADGSGYRIRRIVSSATGQFSGKVYGPYVDPGKFKIGTSLGPYYPVMLDINGNPILYYPAAGGNPQSNLGYSDPKNPLPPSRFNGFDNQNFLDSTSGGTSFSGTSSFAMLASQCGTPPYLLWTAGIDGVFGLDPKGRSDDITNFDLPANLKK